VLCFKSDTDQKAPVSVYGLKEFCDFFSTLRFYPEYIHQLAAIREEGRAIFNESFLNQLQRFQFRFDLKAVPEGYLATDADALLCLYASKIELKIIEHALVNIYSEQNSAEGYNFELEISAFNTDILPALNDNNFIEICREGKMLYFF
jgi:nicotinic acid phosphoribosyltransferase